jgi:EAL domain-containing protein (putative c-di-GMP-specific phosphodiesterase class I)
MYAAKRGGAGSAMYRADEDPNSPDRLLLIGELRRAIDRGQLLLHYQPKVDLRDGHITGVEALVRWQHPQRGLLTPDEFVPLAEQAALIESLSQWVLHTAVGQASAWRRAGFDIPVAVNLSMHSLQDEQLPASVARVLESANLPPSLLVVEITESTLMQDAVRTLAILERLRATGIRVAIDDFGTGHSSLSYLKRLAVDEVKIDRGFVCDIATDETDYIIVRSTVDLAHSLGLRVVAEGVENQITASLLAELACDQGQGFHMSPPLRGDEVVAWASARNLNTDTQPVAA